MRRRRSPGRRRSPDQVPRQPGQHLVPALLQCLADFAAVFITATVLTLGAWATLPVALTSVSATVVMSDSMTPLIRPGDVVLTAPPAPQDVRPGTVLQYDGPGRPSHSMLHRVARIADDGTVVTKGDANRAPDPRPITREDIDGVGRILVPFAGRPAVWLRTGATAFSVWLTVTALAAWWVGWRCPKVIATTTSRPDRRRRAPRAATLAFTGLLIVVILAPHASAAWSAQTSATGAYAAAQLLPPTNVQAASACNGATRGVQLTWTAASGVSSQYEIERRSVLSQVWQPVTTTTGSTYFDQPPVLTVALRYRIRSRAASWSSDWSAESNQVTPPLLCL